MNKLNLLLLAGAAALASCASEDVINSGDINAPSAEGKAMSFSMLTGNMSRGTSAMETSGHKDFGVFAFKGDSYESGKVMANYQVLYSDTNPGDDKDTTWGNGSSSTNGSSYWYYEGARAGQILKYWDYSFPNHYFVAYTPYAETGVTFEKATNFDLTLPSLTSFWTEAERDNKEAMWCQNIVAKTNYNKDVTLTFNHLNAVIKLAFRSNIPGYTVKLINLVPTAATVTGISEVQYGVQLTPATEEQKGTAIGLAENTGAAQPSPLTQLHADVATIKVSDVFGTPAVTTNVTASSSTNLVFNLGETPANNAEKVINNGASADYTPLGSQYFALPLTNAAAYTDTYATGYTLHVSYVLMPTDGAANTTVYDARVFIPADKCQWEYGKSYLYRFTITTSSTGVTDPNQQIYDGGDTPSNYVDPTDPRVPTKQALLPIVFDGVTVTDYTAAADSDHDIN